MPARERDEKNEQHGGPALVNPRMHDAVIERGQRENRDDEGNGQWNEREGSHSLHPPVMHPLLRGALAENPAQRSTQAHTSPRTVISANTSNTVSTSATATTIHALCWDWRFSRPRPVSQM